MGRYATKPDLLIRELAGDKAMAAADTLPLTVRNALVVNYGADLLESILKSSAPELALMATRVY